MGIESINPATLEKLGEVRVHSEVEVMRFAAEAREAQKKWRRLPVRERAAKVASISRHVADHLEEIATLISKEVGKPPDEAFVSELYTSLDAILHYYATAEDVLNAREEINLGFYEALKKKSHVFYKPWGLVAVIGPYNYPFVIPLEQIVQALIAGNAVLFKPSSETVLVGRAVDEAVRSADLPPGLFRTVFGRGSDVGNVLVDEADHIVFTGSTETGKKIMERAARTLTKVSLELGGKSAMVVFPDANLERAARAAVWGAFSNSGQVCASVKRLYLHVDVYDQFLDGLVELTRRLKQGDPLAPGTDVGAMVNLEQLKIVDEKVRNARQQGARVLCGGRRNPLLKGYFYEPTILDGVDNKSLIVQEEIFGPVLVVVPFESEEQVIALVNDNPYGLTASVWTRDLEKGERVAQEIDAGTVMVNEVVYTFALAATPWGGTKASGVGRTHGRLGFLSMVQPVHVHVDSSEEPDLWWMPYDEEFKNVVENFKRIAKALVVKPTGGREREGEQSSE
ncbi:MAG: aldehyde dehydrogenase family protein [Promethearchaeota archaeon]